MLLALSLATGLRFLFPAELKVTLETTWKASSPYFGATFLSVIPPELLQKTCLIIP